MPSQTTAHRTGIPIAAIDINKAKTHAILAGQEILKTVEVSGDRMVEGFNARSGIISYAAASASKSETTTHRRERREYLPAKDVVWSKGDRYDTIIATAANNGRIALYDVSRLNSSRIELAWIHEHTGQVNKLDFDPTGGYLLLSGSQDKTVKIWDIREPQHVKRKQTINIRQPVRDVRWSPTDVGEFALCTENGIVQRWDLRWPSGALLSINAHEKACYAIDWHPDGRHLVSGGFDKYAKVWDLKSDNRRQKPAFQLKTPQAILNIRWRPPCWSSDLTGRGHWQSAQLATSYIEEDPRIHIWDLRRPLLPFREQDRYGSRPTDMLWASEHFLWSVGSQGMFLQTDIRYATLVQDELPTSAIGFMPDGSFVNFSEDLRTRRTSFLEDPAVNFLRIPQERLSGGTDGATSRSISDEEDGDDGLLTASARRHVTKSSRSAKSQGNTPPTGDGFHHVIPLDPAVLNRKGFFSNHQSGINSSITGVAAEPEIVEFLAENYARPMTSEDRQQNPSQILERLHQAFVRNANACDYVAMHRMAQSWRILSAVIIPELTDWVDANRNHRLEVEAKRKASVNESKMNTFGKGLPLYTTLARAKLMGNLFRGVSESERLGSDPESTSNMTTPMAKPLPDSPAISQHQDGNTFLSLNETIESIPPLPPSVVHSHSTAAAASKALLESAGSDSTSSSPERARRPGPLQQHRRTVTDVPLVLTDWSAQFQSPKVQPVTKQTSSPLAPPSPRMELRKQEDRRAAIRDFRAQQRQLFTFEENLQDPKYASSARQNSNESFLMFSASTDSSSRARSLGQSSDFDKGRTQRGSEDWQSVRLEDTNGTPASGTDDVLYGSQRISQTHGIEYESLEEDFPMDESNKLGFGLNDVANSKTEPVRPKPPASASMWDIRELRESGSLSQSETMASSSSGGAFSLEVATTQQPNIYTSNPIRRIVSKMETATNVAPSETHNRTADEGVDSKEYIYADFRPIDFTTYESRLPWAWSALPLLCHSIAFDISEGIASAQFSVHLLMHLYAFFFDPQLQLQIQPGIATPNGVAEKLMRPDLSHRIIEGLFLNHYLYLKKMGLYRPMTELRNICVDLGFNATFEPNSADQPVGTSLKQDPYRLQISCSYCYSFMHAGAVQCQNCGQSRGSCPICLQLQQPHDNDNVLVPNESQGSPYLWSFCQACGHGGHWTCMQKWILQPDAQGECPTRGCGCDCGPGLVRKQRIAHQLADVENSEIIRGGRGSTVTKKDPVKASPSPAVDKTRDTLRNTSEMTRDSSGDERMRRSFSGRGGSRGGLSIGGSASRGASQSFGRRVRLVTPGEESGPSYSVS